MGALQRIASAWSALTRANGNGKSQPPSSGAGSGYIGGPAYTDAFGMHPAPSPWKLIEAYKSLIYACVAINEQAVVRIPFRLYADSSKPGGKPRSFCEPRPAARSMHQHLRTLPYLRTLSPDVEDVTEVGNHPLLDALDKPDPTGQYFDKHQLFSLIVRYCDVVGVAYLWPDGPKGMPPRYLWPLYSQYVFPIRRADSVLLEGYQYFAEQIPFDQLLRFRTKTSLKDPYGAGYSPTYAAIEYARLEDQFVSIQDHLLSAGPRPSIVFSPKDPSMAPGEPERQRFEIDLDRKLSRAGAGRHLVTNGAWDVTPISYSPQDLAGLQISEYDRERIGNCFGVPPPYLTGDTNLANMQAADQFHARNAVEPRCHMIASVFTRLAKMFDPRLFFAFDPACPEDEEKAARIVDMNLKNGRITINQANEESPYEPVAWGDEPWISGTLVQPSMATEKHEQGMESAKAGAEALKAKAENPQAEDQPPKQDQETSRRIARVLRLVEARMGEK